MNQLTFILTVFVAFTSSPSARSEVDFKIKLEKYFVSIEKMSEKKEFINLFNRLSTQAEKSKMDNSKWSKLPVRDPEVQEIYKNELSQFLKNELGKFCSEGFINSINGNKVAFLTKPTSFNHKGKDKHEIPLKGLRWIGNPGLDQSTGENQIQIAAPININKKVEGTIVLGIKLVELL